ncbi:RIO1-domain-containing protein [Pisolithus orientalis]|uniref:RIO1-domain-containing protein n=1 Tax=Pisolithus orientalis TaxID=936130 RepID=UPI002224327B|nr:RIO1-domain-containing protein [Pisolithus orientalis]KAI6030861.1 RIO1-domain-containing protein [Pisolithus orientalis]
MSTDNPLSLTRDQFNGTLDQDNTRNGGHYVDDADQWSSSTDEDVDDELSDDDFEDSRVEDEDWEIAERDFTKQYNRLRQHVAVRTGNAQGTHSSINQNVAVASLPAVNQPRAAGATAPAHAKDKTTGQLASLLKYTSRIAKIDQPYVLGVGVNRKGPSSYANLKDKSDRATSELVLDPRTRLVLFKMIGRGLIQEVNGCVSTGKEANVYHALTPDNQHLALKIYKTSILVFKDRDRYVTGEHRFRHGYSRNPRKMVRLWAEKEMRNLKRLVAAGIYCPDPVEVKENVLVMKFLGDKEGWASPRLKDAEIPSSDYPSLYQELVLNMRRMYHQCKLVHADLSEYNIIYHDSHLYIIDVSQSVEHDHPAAYDFLRKDIKNVEEYFGRFGVTGLGIRRCFDFITREVFGEDSGTLDEREILVQCISEVQQAPQPQEQQPSGEENDSAKVPTKDVDDEHDAAHQDHEENVFLRSYIPRTLNEVYDPERDIDALKQGKGLIYRDTIGLVDPAAASQQRKPENGGHHQHQHQHVHFDDRDEQNEERPDRSSDMESDDDSDGSSTAGEEDLEGEREGDGEVEKDNLRKVPRGHRHEDREAKKERKKAVKAEAREKRKNKIPKAEKKRRIKVTQRSR